MLPRDWTYRPAVVKQVLRHYTLTNDLYQEVKLVFDADFESQAQENATINAPSFELPVGALDSMPFPSSDEPAPPDVFHDEEPEVGSLIEQVEALVRNEQESNVITGDQTPFEFVSPHNDPHFDQKAFPDLYPCQYSTVYTSP
jgi:hypothetical protein